MKNLLTLDENIGNITIGCEYYNTHKWVMSTYPMAYPNTTFVQCRLPKRVAAHFTNLVFLDLEVNHNFESSQFSINRSMDRMFGNLDTTISQFNEILDVLYKYRKIFKEMYNSLDKKYTLYKFNYTKKVEKYISDELQKYVDLCAKRRDGFKRVYEMRNTPEAEIISRHYKNLDRYDLCFEHKFLEKAILLTINLLNGQRPVTDEQKKEGIKLYGRLNRYLTMYAANTYNELIYRVLKTNINMTLSKKAQPLSSNGFKRYQGSFANPDHFYILQRFELKAFNEILKSGNINDCEKYGIGRVKMRWAIRRDIKKEVLRKINDDIIDIDWLKEKIKLKDEEINEMFLDFIN